MRNSTYKPSSGYKTSFYQKLPLVSSNNEITNTLVFTKHKHNDREGNEVTTNVLLEKTFDNRCEAEAHGAVSFGHYGGCGSSICHNWNVDNKHELVNPEDYYNL